jgi:hypothetical protein
MDSILADLEQATADLMLVCHEGLLRELKESIAYALRGQPRTDWEAHPGLKANVDEGGELLHLFTGLPLELCKLAQLNQLLPSNRSRQSLDVLRDFADRIRAEEATRRAANILDIERRRRGGRRAS